MSLAKRSRRAPFSPVEVRSFVLASRARSAAFAVEVAALRLRLALRAWSTDQPRVPAGSPDGGRWTDGVGGGGSPARSTEPRIREAQLSPRRGTRPYPTVRINGRDVPMTEGEEAEMVGWRINRAAALAEVWKRDPSWRPPTSLYATPRGAISAVESDALAADERLRELDYEEGAASKYVYRDGAGRRTDDEICRPNGEWIGERFGRARGDVTTVDSSTFKSIWQELSAGARPLPSNGRYERVWYETVGGGIVGLRNSEDNGWTLDLARGSFYRSRNEDMKIHYSRDLQVKAMQQKPVLEVRGYEFQVDSSPMWSFLKASWRLTDDPTEQRAFVRACILRMLETGAVPYEHRDGVPYGMDTSRWDGKAAEAIADDIVEATFATPDIFNANIWWASRRYP